MQFTTVLVALLATAVSAAPAPAEVSKRACQFVAASPPGVSVSKGSPQGVAFYPPSSAVGACQLEAYFPAGFAISSSGAAAVNVIDVNGNSPGSIVGTITFASSPTEPTRRFINSFGCRSYMAYRLEIAGAGPGSVSFPATPGAGLRMSHSC
ncbi:hypothetical protein GGTG_06110 [Gaeumannomyces tritici R3-111a-1]|uniref:Ubiquitin 3 binding protein But2 C-terminal domain-containing protein n=1 Tax=Gaeumannomyces tritici (strain R3-111a-1) TaxID=644352 RepID=J3NXV5_GAET3|nr:hypothetical protein GGTG_06110 [Gaeumannomyces tritici R3-111a-1]EJT76188.1 hypothetical protein GGTG_06110 [Gaeumannomyces tritici R3-111a-1]